MKKNNLVLTMVLTLTMTLTSSIVANALEGRLKESMIFPENTSQEQQEQYYKTDELKNEALSEKTFYKYNVAYAAILEIPNKELQDYLLRGLANITNEVWTDDIKAINKTISELAANGSGKVYDEVQNQINKSNIAEVDKQYLLGEVTSWGQKLVFSPDYVSAVDAVVKAWQAISGESKNTSIIFESFKNAQKFIDEVKNPYSKEYLNEQLNEIRLKAFQHEKVEDELVFDKEYTESLNTGVITYMKNRADIDPKIEELIQSAINITKDKDVVDAIKTSWKPSSKSDRMAQFTEYKVMTFLSDNPRNDYRLSGNVPPSPSANFAVFNYSVVYWNETRQTYQVYNLSIGI